MKTILLLINPKARSGEGAYEALEEALTRGGHKVLPLDPEERKVDCRQLILKYKNDIDFVLVGGGDGSINYVLSSLVEVQIPLIVYPLGTANLLGRSLGLTADAEELLHLIETGKVISIDLGVVNNIYFINVCGLGISTEVNRIISPALKKFTGPLSFWITGVKLCRKLKPFKIKLTVDNKDPVQTKTWQITVCNGRKYAAWMTIEPEASYSDGVLHCLSTEVKEWWQGIKLLPSYIKGSYKNKAEVTLLAGKEIRVETKKPLQIDVDGDIQTSTPAVFSVKSKVLKILVPHSALHDERPVSS